MLCVDPASGTPTWLALCRCGVEMHYRNRFAPGEALVRTGSRCAATRPAAKRDDG